MLEFQDAEKPSKRAVSRSTLALSASGLIRPTLGLYERARFPRESPRKASPCFFRPMPATCGGNRSLVGDYAYSATEALWGWSAAARFATTMNSGPPPAGKSVAGPASSIFHRGADESPARSPARRRKRVPAVRQVARRGVRGFQDELLGMLYYVVGNAEDARDALQDAFIKCWKHREDLVEIDNPRAWVFRVALNAGRDARGTAWRRHRRAWPDDGRQLVGDQRPAGDQGDRQRAIGHGARGHRRLRPEEQEVFLLRQDGQMTYEQIADTIGIPVGTVKTRMRLALAGCGKR